MLHHDLTVDGDLGLGEGEFVLLQKVESGPAGSIVRKTTRHDGGALEVRVVVMVVVVSSDGGRVIARRERRLGCRAAHL
jgi:hypothetical protein